MAIVRRVRGLGSGRLKVKSSLLYAVPDATDAEIFKITLVNTSAATVTVNVQMQIGPNLYQLTPLNMAMAAGELRELTDYTLGPGSMLVGDASAEKAIDYTVNGAQEA